MKIISPFSINRVKKTYSLRLQKARQQVSVITLTSWVVTAKMFAPKDVYAQPTTEIQMSQKLIIKLISLSM